MRDYDVIVIGSGGGTKIARAAGELGLRTALIEQDDFGGTCLNRGCIPSKMLIHPAAQRDSLRHAEHLGLYLRGELTARFDEIAERIAAEVGRTSAGLLAGFRAIPAVDVLRGRAVFTGRHAVEVDGVLLSAPRVFIATGSRSDVPAIDGLAGTPYMTSREALSRRNLPRRMVVIGAGYIAVELGYAYAAYGCEVQFVVRSRFLRHEDREIAGEFDRVFSARHTVHKEFNPRKVSHDGTEFKLECVGPGGAVRELTCDALLVATGVVPNTDGLGLEQACIAVDANGFIQVDPCLRTNVEGVYALGDVVGRYFYRHTVNREAEYLIDSVLRGSPVGPLQYGPVPHAVFTHPQVAGVGATEEELRQAGVPLTVGRATYADSAPGMARRSDHGLVKILVHAHGGELLGAHIVGDEAADILHLFIAMMQQRATLSDLQDMIFIHPALAEVARDAGRNAAKQS